MRRRPATLVALALPCMAYAVVALLTERPFALGVATANREQRAAVAIRDNVTPFQKWGSKQFTVPYLERSYAASWYVTQARTDDGKAAFLSALGTALERYAEVDLYLLAHSNVFINWVAELPADRRARLRLVYNTGCRDVGQGPAWLALGAKAYVGHPGVSASPVFYTYFLRRWTRGGMLADAVREGNREMASALARLEVATAGQVNAAALVRESEASAHGDDRITFAGE